MLTGELRLAGMILLCYPNHAKQVQEATQMSKNVVGIHHVTAIAGDPQKNLDFYVKLLGLRLLKLTVNYDDPATYHFYYGNHIGSPGSALTFFPWPGMVRGRKGNGEVLSTAFSVPVDSFPYWLKRLNSGGVQVREVENAFEEDSLIFEDPDGMEIRLVESNQDTRVAWRDSDVPSEAGIRGFHSVTLSVEGYERTAGIMMAQLGFRQWAEKGSRFRYVSGDGAPGTIVDILCQPDLRAGVLGAGSVHHVAFRVKDEKEQLAIREGLVKAGMNVTPVIDRNYFRSIYFREPGRVLFEIATDGPGFAVDEKVDELGLSLRLPPFLEEGRSEIEKVLPKIILPNGQSIGSRERH